MLRIRYGLAVHIYCAVCDRTTDSAYLLPSKSPAGSTIGPASARCSNHSTRLYDRLIR